MEYNIDKYFNKNHIDRKMCVTLKDFTGFEGVIRKIDDSHYLHFENCFKFAEARKLNVNFEGEKLFVGKMKIYYDDVLDIVVRELVPPKKDTKKSKIRYLSLPYLSPFRRANGKSRAIKKANALKQRKLAKEERKLRKSWSNFFDLLSSLDITPFLHQNDVMASSASEKLRPVSPEAQKEKASNSFQNRLVADSF